jgi:flagellar hook protein FlgE
MMRSLWSGVSGLNAHQTAMDVEANNIANVNTVGFKYSRTNFQNLLSQTIKSATGPEGDLGGKNSLQIGLGTSVSAVETMYKQGSIQNTDKNTDMAINGDGFFIVSADNGKTYRYTRAGDFSFDANGNFVDPNGYIVQGWLADNNYKIDTSSGIKPIKIEPGLTTPAKATSEIDLKANLNSGDKIEEMSATRPTVNQNADFNDLYDESGEKILLTPDKDKITLKITDNNGNTNDYTFTYGKSTSNDDRKFETIKDLIDEINEIIKDTTGETPSAKYKLYVDGDGKIVDPKNRVDFESSTNKILEKIFQNLNTSNSTLSIKAIQNSFVGADDVGELFDANGEAINLEEGQGITVNIDGLGETRKFVYSKMNSNENCSTSGKSYLKDSNIMISDSNEGLHWTYDSNQERAFINVNQKIEFEIDKDGDGTADTTFTYIYGKDFQTLNDLCCALNNDLNNANIKDQVHFENGKIIENTNNITKVSLKDSNDNNAQDGTPLKRLEDIFKSLGDGKETNNFYKNDIYYFQDIEDLVNIWQLAIDDSGDSLNSTSNNSGIVSIDKDGRIQIKNTSPNSFNIKVDGYPENNDNESFTNILSSLGGTIAAGSSTISQSMNAATHTTSIDVFDSLGSKHTITLHFRKTHTADSQNDLSVWKWYADVPAPATLNNPANGYIKFNSDGSINTYTPNELTLNPNNGASSNQKIELNFGKEGFDGITSFEAPSSTNGESQDGYPGGDLQNLVIDQTGKIIGVFTNGKSFSLAQVAIAKFTNNEGLMNEGGTLFSASPNSGDPIIGVAGSGGRGSITPSALEMSNVDLSRSLTQLIVIQRGFQANSKTITTSDEMLNTLLQLKR